MITVVVIFAIVVVVVVCKCYFSVEFFNAVTSFKIDFIINKNNENLNTSLCVFLNIEDFCYEH